MGGPVDDFNHSDSVGFTGDSRSSKRNSRSKYYIGALLAVVLIVAVVGGVVASGGGGSSSSSNVLAPSPTTGNSNPAPAPTPFGSTAAPTSEIASIVRNFALNNGVEFDDPDSYQSKALAWIEDTGVPSLTINLANADDRVVQRYALACIYYASNEQRTAATDFAFGPEIDVLPWLNERGWLTFDDECDWYGITCNDITGLVEEIDLSNNILTGLFPPETQLLKDSLKVLDIYSNYVFNVGDAGNAFLGELTLLEELYYGTTSFQYDGIPTYIGKLTNLYEYDCSYTLYFGELREEVFENLNQLEYLYIGGNSFNSSIPTNIGKLPNLLYFYAEYSDIIGDLSFMKGMPQIYELWADRNPLLTGPLYSEIGDCTTLESFSVTRCGLEGKIPSELGKLVNMQQMWFYNNDLTGAVPTELGLLADMNRLELELNGLTGVMPVEVCDRVKPKGKLEVLETDCEEGAVEIECICCTCCGESCADDQEQGNAGNAGTRARQRKQR
jgi:Leucine-rich repeat (LRR) protein